MVYRHIVPPGEVSPVEKPKKPLAPRGKAAKNFAARRTTNVDPEASPVLTSAGYLTRAAYKLIWKDQQQGVQNAQKSKTAMDSLLSASRALSEKDQPQEGMTEERMVEIIEAILCAVSEGHPLKTTCEAMGVRYHLVYTRIQKDPQLRDRLEWARRSGLWARADMVIETSEKSPLQAKVLSEMVQWQSKHLMPDIYGPPKQSHPTTLIQIGIRGGGDQGVQVLAAGATDTKSLISLGGQADLISADHLPEPPAASQSDPQGSDEA